MFLVDAMPAGSESGNFPRIGAVVGIQKAADRSDGRARISHPGYPARGSSCLSRWFCSLRSFGLSRHRSSPRRSLSPGCSRFQSEEGGRSNESAPRGHGWRSKTKSTFAWNHLNRSARLQGQGLGREKAKENKTCSAGAIIFLIVVLIAAALGFGGLAGTAIVAAKLVFVVAIVAFLGSAWRQPHDVPVNGTPTLSELDAIMTLRYNVEKYVLRIKVRIGRWLRIFTSLPAAKARGAPS